MPVLKYHLYSPITHYMLIESQLISKTQLVKTFDPFYDQMTKLDLTHHLHMAIIPWVLGHWFISMFILRLIPGPPYCTRDLFLLGSRTCSIQTGRMFYSVKLGRVLYVAIHSTCIIMILFWFLLSTKCRDGIIMTGFQCCDIKMYRMYCSICTNMFQN